MKTIFRFFGTGALTAALVALTAVAGFGQDAPSGCADIDGHNALYTKFTEIYAKKSSADMKVALSTGKEYLEKFGACEAFKDQVEFVKPQVARIEKALPGQILIEELRPLFVRFDNGIKSDNGDEIYGAGREILAKDPENINIIVPMGVAGLYQAYNNNPKYADDTIRYAKLALDKLKSGATSPKKNAAGATTYGALKFEFTKEQAMDELQYSVAHLTFYAKKDQKGALPLFYEIAQGNGRYKEDPRVFQAIGSYFGGEVLRLNVEVAKLIAEQKAKPTDEEKVAMEPKIKETIGILNGTAERAMDYYSRAYRLAKSDTPAAKTYKDSLYKDLGILYEGRFNKKDGLDAYISSAVAKPLANPTTPVSPVIDPDEPTTTTTTTTSAPAPAKPATTTTSNKPVSTIPAKVTVAKKGTRN